MHEKVSLQFIVVGKWSTVTSRAQGAIAMFDLLFRNLIRYLTYSPVAVNIHVVIGACAKRTMADFRGTLAAAPTNGTLSLGVPYSDVSTVNAVVRGVYSHRRDSWCKAGRFKEPLTATPSSS